MDSDSYKIIVSISHRRISFEYWQRDGENKLLPFPPGNWPAPLAFYCSPTGVVIGEEALRAAHAGIENAFTDYFNHLSDAETCKAGGNRRPIRNLLLEGAEEIFNDFYRNVLIRFGSLSDNRASMPLTIVCESDVLPHERAFLKGLFHDSGYTRTEVIEYERYIHRFLREEYGTDRTFSHALVAWTEGTDLSLSLFSLAKSEHEKRQAMSFEGLGLDPRMEYVKKRIWERIQGQNPWLNFSEEEDTLEKIASDFLNSGQPMIESLVVLSDGQSYRYSLNRTSIDSYRSQEASTIQEKTDWFLSQHEVTDKNRVLLLLRGNVAGNSYFESNLRPGFGRLVKSDRTLREKAMRYLLEKTQDSSQVDMLIDCRYPVDDIVSKPQKDYKTRQRNIQQPNFESDLHQIPTTQEAYTIPDREIGPSPQTVRMLKREWREVKADAKGKTKIMKYDEAQKMLEDFLQKCGKLKVAELIIEVSETIPQLLKDKPTYPDSKELQLPRKKQPVKQAHPKKGTRSAEEKKTQSVEQPPKIPEGQQLAMAGKIKEARDWYRQEGHTNMARVMSDILRARKSVEARVKDLDDCRESRDANRISRIINELEDYIDLCKKGNVAASEYVKLLSEYKRIKK